MATGRFDFTRTIAELRATAAGRERDMYPRIRDLLVHVFEHPTARVLVDAGIEGGRGIPDLTLRAPTGVNDARGDPMLTNWAVFEVKDEHGAFSTAASREAIFTEKYKYIGVGTEWFVMVDPTCLIARPVTFRGGSANLNSAISGNSGHQAGPRRAWREGVFDGQEICAPYAAHPQPGIQGAGGVGRLA